MFDTLYIGTSGLLQNAKALQIVGNNLANVNTPGFKGASLQFASVFEQNGGQQASTGSDFSGGNGAGVESTGTVINFTAGTDQTTGNPLDVAINGNGFYTVKRDGDILYTRSGDFQFDAAGLLVNGQGDHVQGLDGNGKLVDISLASLGESVPKATSTVSISGNLTSTVATPVVDATLNGVQVIDANGASHPVNLTFHDNTGGNYTVTITDALGATLGTGTLKFAGGFPQSGFSNIAFSITPAGGSAMTVNLDFSTNVTALTDPSTLSVASQDGYVAGVRTDQSIGADGVVTVHYSNGKTAKGARLALASFNNNSDLDESSGSDFTVKPGDAAHYGFASTSAFGTLAAGHREGSNVDLAAEFSNLIVMQRGYQAASHVISTANDMIQELFDMKGNH